MSLLIYHTSDSIENKYYNEILSEYSPIYFGINDKTKNFFFDGKSLNFKAALPIYIQKNGIIEYAENYEKNIEQIYEKLRKTFFDKYCYFFTRNNGDSLGGIYDYLYYFRIYIKASVRFLDENKIKFVFMATPSAGFDNIFSEVSKLMGIEYIGLIQIHNNRFFWIRNWNDVGLFSTSLPIFPSHEIKVEQEIYDPYYMVRVQTSGDKDKNKNFIFKAYFQFIKNVISPIYYAFKIVKLVFGYYFVKKSYKPAEWLSFGNKLRFFSYKFIQLTSSIQRKNLEKKLSFKNDKSLKILLYLKVQPEATEAFTETYCDDQLLIIDKLQSLSPPNTKIYIKEHPDETRNDPMARANFWTSVSKKKNLVIISTDEKTSSLINNFDLIATIDGTIGWEAIKNFKPVICFGKPWYLSMPGVFEASKVYDLTSILIEKWTLADLNKKFTELTKKMAPGYVCHLKSGTINSYDEFTNYKPLSSDQKKKMLLENDKVVAKSFHKIIKSVMRIKELGP